MDSVVSEGDTEKFTRTVYGIMQGGKIPKRLPMGLDALGAVNIRIENLKATVDETTGWSVDLRRAGGGVGNIVMPT